MLHLTKVAAGCRDVETLAARQREYWGEEAASLTRFMPKRAEALIGGSLYWIIGHRLVARQRILAIAMVETQWGPKCRIALQPGPVAVQAVPCRAHQGWRYLADGDAPPDLTDAMADVDALPVGMLRELQSLWLI